jgi:spore maturation protein CgeB
MGLRIAWFGSSLVSTWWNGAATYYRGLIRALDAHGHRVTFYEPDAWDRQAHRDIDDPPWARVVVYPDAAGLQRALQEAEGADLVVKCSGVGAFDRELEAAVAELRGPGRKVAYWDVDAPATLAQLDADPADPLRARIPQYDIVFTYGGGPPIVAGYEAIGARAVVPIYNAVDPTTHFPEPPQPRFAADLAFLGNRLPDREARVERFFLEAARLAPHRTFLLGGNGWADKPLPPNVRLVGHVGSDDHNAFSTSARAVLNLHRESMAATGWSPATRVFEAMGAGACVISDPFPGVDDFFAPGREILLADGPEAVLAQLDRLTPERRTAIGDAARARVLADHTYDHRARRFEEAIAALHRGTRLGAAAHLPGGAA